MFSGLCAQQPAADSTSKRAASQATNSSNVVNQVAVQSNGLPVPFATVFNINTGQAAVANAEGIAAVPVWGVNDTLRIQSMGYETVTLVPGTMLNLIELPQSMVEIEEVVVQSHAVAAGAMTRMSTASLGPDGGQDARPHG